MAVARRALITGVSGQDGYYLARHLLDRGREVLGVSRGRPSHPAGTHRVLDISEHAKLRELISEFAPDEIYHLAAYHRSSAAGVSLSEKEEEELYFRNNIESTRALLRATLELRPRCRIFLAGSCHLFGNAQVSPQSETTPIRPNSLYGITKANNFWLGQYYRQSLGMFCATGILYNHESPLRGPTFVTTKIASAAARIAAGLEEELVLGDLDAQVDWGFAGDYVEAMVHMLEGDEPEDLIIGSGELHRVRDFAELAFAHVGLDWRLHVRQADGLHHPVARTVYFGDTTRIRKRGWAPRVPFPELVRQMVDAHR
ncbi:MAG: GDP-mannose 4,6-dehydratase [Polyangiaceae bacterium]|nr:GDP-mannose 4,6-dehydratase [Polyangiaceae bacterium]